MVAGVSVPLPPISGVPWAVPCSAARGGGGDERGGLAVVLVPFQQGLVVIHRHWGGRPASHAADTSRHSS